MHRYASVRTSFHFSVTFVFVFHILRARDLCEEVKVCHSSTVQKEETLSDQKVLSGTVLAYINHSATYLCFGVLITTRSDRNDLGRDKDLC